jgi:tetratricopeptide (TPR) repeat protein
MEELRTLLSRGRFRAAMQLARQQQDPALLLEGALAALHAGDRQVAQSLLDRLPSLADPYQESMRLALLGRVRFLQGDQLAYGQLAQRSVDLDQNYTALFHLGQSLAPDMALAQFQEALVGATTPQDEGKAAYGLARVLEKLGRYREGLVYAGLALLRDPHPPQVILAYANLALTGGDNVVWDDLARRVEPCSESSDFSVRLVALHVLAEISLIQGRLEEALNQSEHILSTLDRHLLPLVVWQAVRIRLQLGQRDWAVQLARAAELSEFPDPAFRGIARLALGHALYPAPQSEAVFAEALDLLDGVAVGPAVISRAFLASLRQQPQPAEDLALIAQWSAPLRAILPAASRLYQPVFSLRVLGQNTLYGPQGAIPLRQRSLELLVLLASKPDGWRREDLSLALYGQINLNAVKVELTRLRKILGTVLQTGPWRLDGSLVADFVEMQKKLYHRDLTAALQLYQGPLLPRSEAPGIEELRRQLEEELRLVGLHSTNAEALMQLAHLLDDDLEVWEALLRTVPQADPRFFTVYSRVKQLRQHYLGQLPG